MALLWLWSAPIAFARAGGDTYTVQPGDTLSRIALRYQISVAELARINGLRDPDLIRAGQKLTIPKAAQAGSEPAPTGTLRGGVVPYRVQSGDTLFLLAKRYGTTVEAIAQANGLRNPHQIIVGQWLSIPTTITEDVPHMPSGPIAAVQVIPPVVQQGQTLLVRVQLSAPAQLTIWFDGRLLLLAKSDSSYWGLAPIGALMAPGRKDLRVQATWENETIEVVWPVWVVQGDYPVQNITLPPAKSELLDPVKLREERERLAAVWAETAPEPLWDGPFATPLAPGFATSSPFGVRRAYNDGPVNSYHEGHDFSAPEGTPVVAPAAGRVILAEPLTVRGNAVVIDHGLGVHTGYWHLSRIDVKPGQLVQPGDPVGLVGTTGLSTGAHLHWELRIGDVPVDPMEWTRRSFP